MPYYNFVCYTCGKESEVEMSISEIGNYVAGKCICGDDMFRKYTPIATRTGRRRDEMQLSNDDTVENQGCDSTKEYETIHDVPIGYLKDRKGV